MSTTGRFSAVLTVTLWLTGLLVALLTGMLSAYLLVSVVVVGSRAFARLRSAGEARKAERLGSGD